MAGKIQFNRIVNANVYLNGINRLGQAKEIKLPEISAKMEDHDALGMIGAVEFAAGFEKMEGEINWNSFYEEAALLMANPFTSVALMCRSNLETHGSQGRISEVELVTHLTVTFKKNPLGNFTPRTNAEFSSSFSATYVKQVVDGREVLEVDFLSNIFRVGGEDMLQNFRTNIGA